VFKKGISTDVSNYRPISLTSLCCKLMESIITDDILAHLPSKDLISRHHHGFFYRVDQLALNLLTILGRCENGFIVIQHFKVSRCQ